MARSTFTLLLQNLALMAISTLLTLAAIEGGFRLYGKLTEADGLEALQQAADRPAVGAKVKLGQIIRLSSSPRIIYELMPDISVSFIGATVETNRDGFRGPLVEAHKPEGVKRIVGIGDSVMFGWGVDEHESYLGVLRESLRAAGGPSHWEIINTAVPGYNTAIEVDVLREKGLQYQPDIVILGFVSNDFQLPRFIREPVDYLALDRSFALERLGLSRAESDKLSDTVAQFAPSGRALGDVDLAQVPAAYHYMVGTQGVINSFEALQALSEQHGFEVILLVMRFIPAEVRSAALERGFHLLNATRLWKQYAQEQGYADIQARFQRSKSDPHPAAEAHGVIAAGLLELILALEDNAH